MENDLYLGHNIKYWLELEKRATELDVVDFIEEIVELRGQLSLIKDRVEQINKVLVE